MINKKQAHNRRGCFFPSLCRHGRAGARVSVCVPTPSQSRPAPHEGAGGRPPPPPRPPPFAPTPIPPTPPLPLSAPPPTHPLRQSLSSHHITHAHTHTHTRTQTMPLPRVAPGAVLVVPPFECAWLADAGAQLVGGAGCVTFEVRGEKEGERGGGRGRFPSNSQTTPPPPLPSRPGANDATVIFKPSPGSKRWQHAPAGGAPRGGARAGPQVGEDERKREGGQQTTPSFSSANPPPPLPPRLPP